MLTLRRLRFFHFDSPHRAFLKNFTLTSASSRGWAFADPGLQTHLLYRLTICYTCAEGGRRTKVTSRLAANSVTAVISVIAETGSHAQAERSQPW